MIWADAERLAALPVETPALAIDPIQVEKNIRAAAELVRALGGSLRPHLKTHKSVEIAALQRAHGIAGATVATVAEAELALAAGIDDVLVAYPPVPQWRADALGRLAESARVTVSCSDIRHAEVLHATGHLFDVYWEIEVGTRRLGTAPGAPTADPVADLVSRGLARFRGLLAFTGNAYAADDDAGLSAVQAHEQAALVETVELLAARGIETPVVSVGTTPVLYHETGFATEYRFGNYAFYDATQVALGSATLDQCALAVVTTVLDTPSPTTAVVDAGSKSIPAERMTPRTEDLGIVVGHPDLHLGKLYEEHGLLSATAPHGLRIGDRLAIIPNHACTCVNLFSAYTVVGADGELERWAVRARR